MSACIAAKCGSSPAATSIGSCEPDNTNVL
jgi:hypothetical protein